MDLLTPHIKTHQSAYLKYLVGDIGLSTISAKFILHLMTIPIRKILEDFHTHQFKRNDHSRFRDWINHNISANLANYLIAENLESVDSHKCIYGCINYIVDRIQYEDSSPYSPNDSDKNELGQFTSPWHILTIIKHTPELASLFDEEYIEGSMIETFKTLKLPISIANGFYNKCYYLTFEAVKGMIDMLSVIDNHNFDMKMYDTSIIYDIEHMSCVGSLNAQYFHITLDMDHESKIISFLTPDYMHGVMTMASWLSVDYNRYYHDLNISFPTNLANLPSLWSANKSCTLDVNRVNLTRSN